MPEVSCIVLEVLADSVRLENIATRGTFTWSPRAEIIQSIRDEYELCQSLNAEMVIGFMEEYVAPKPQREGIV